MIRFQCLGVNIKMNNFLKKIICLFFSVLIFCNLMFLKTLHVSAYVTSPNVFSILYSFAMTLASDKRLYDDLAVSIDTYFSEQWLNSDYRHVFYPNIGTFTNDDIQKIKNFRHSINSTGKIPSGYTNNDIAMSKYDIDYFDSWVSDMSVFEKQALITDIRNLGKNELGIEKFLFDLDMVRSAMVSFNEYVDKIVDERIKIDGMDMNVPYLDVLDMRQKIFDSYGTDTIKLDGIDFEFLNSALKLPHTFDVTNNYISNFLPYYDEENEFIIRPFFVIDDEIFIGNSMYSFNGTPYDYFGMGRIVTSSNNPPIYISRSLLNLQVSGYYIKFNRLIIDTSSYYSDLKYYNNYEFVSPTGFYDNSFFSENINKFEDFGFIGYTVDRNLTIHEKYDYITPQNFSNYVADVTNYYKSNDIETVFAPVLDVARPKDVLVSLPMDKTSVSAADIVVTDTKSGTITNVAAISSGSVYDLDFNIDVPKSIFQKFPFSLPWDFYNLVHIFSAEPIVPSFVIPFKYENIFDFSIDLSLERFGFISDVSRSLFYVVFLVFLIFSTKKLIWNGG